jgi:hypothetical protein
MFALCEGMKWAHLPVAGGLYDQHPDLLDGFRYMFSVRAEKEEAERKKQEAESKRQQRGKAPVAGGRRR